jgi:hypothetical protein
MNIGRDGYILETSESQDELYGNLYIGKTFEVKSLEDAVKINIAMKATSINWKEFAGRKIETYTSLFSVIKKDSFVILFYTGFIASLVVLYISPSILNGILAAIYTVLLIYRLFFKKKNFGTVLNSLDKPVPFSMISLYGEQEPDRRISFAVSDVVGRYFLLAKNGNYLMGVKGQELNGNKFSKMFRVTVEGGILTQDVIV